LLLVGRIEAHSRFGVKTEVTSIPLRPPKVNCPGKRGGGSEREDKVPRKGRPECLPRRPALASVAPVASVGRPFEVARAL